MNRFALRFFLIFVGSMAVYFLLSVKLRLDEVGARASNPWLVAILQAQIGIRRTTIENYEYGIAATAGALLRLAGQEAKVMGREIHSGRSFSVSVTSGCDALEPSLLLLAAILAFPAQTLAKMTGLVGLVAIAALNVVRVSSIWLVGVYWPAAIDIIHFIVWPFVLVMFTCGSFLIWARRAASEKVRTDTHSTHSK